MRGRDGDDGKGGDGDGLEEETWRPRNEERMGEEDERGPGEGRRAGSCWAKAKERPGEEGDRGERGKFMGRGIEGVWVGVVKGV